jgi:YidC/Oxa1 family membrane protein insertase
VSIAASFITPAVVQRAKFQNVRYNSTTQAASEIQKQLPSFETITETASQASQAIGEASLNWGYMQSIGLAKSWWWPPDLVQHLMEIVHVSTGLPWWATITLVTVGVRLALFPLYVKSSDMMAKNAKIKPQLDEIQAKLMSAVDMSESQSIMLKRKKLLAEHGVKNRYLLAPMLQIPLAIGFFSGLRAMSNYPVDGLQDQGILWFQDLTAADPYLGLQCLSAAVIMGFMRLGGETGAQTFSPAMKKVFTILPLISIPATMSFSSAVVLYFFVNGLFSVLQSFVLKQKFFRNALGLSEIVPPPPADPNKPQEGIMESFRKNMERAREQAEKRAEAKAKEDEQKKMAEKQKQNNRIKIVRKSDLQK